jgi:hypothetical protein
MVRVKSKQLASFTHVPNPSCPANANPSYF